MLAYNYIPSLLHEVPHIHTRLRGEIRQQLVLKISNTMHEMQTFERLHLMHSVGEFSQHP